MSKLTLGFLKFIDLKRAWLDRGFLFFFPLGKAGVVLAPALVV